DRQNKQAGREEQARRGIPDGGIGLSVDHRQGRFLYRDTPRRHGPRGSRGGAQAEQQGVASREQGARRLQLLGLSRSAGAVAGRQRFFEAAARRPFGTVRRRNAQE